MEGSMSISKSLAFSRANNICMPFCKETLQQKYEKWSDNNLAKQQRNQENGGFYECGIEMVVLG